MRRHFLMLALILCATPVIAQQTKTRNASDEVETPRLTTLKELFSGKLYPMTRKLKDLDEEWRRVTISGPFDMNNYAMTLSTMFRRNIGETVYYTQGETVQVGTETYAISYRPKMKPQPATKDRSTRDASLPEPESLTRNTVLSFTLLNLRTSGSLTDIRPFSLEEEIGGGGDTIAKETRAIPLVEQEKPGGGKTVLAEKHTSPAAKHESQSEVIEVSPSTSPEVASLANLKQLGTAISLYLEDNGNIFPPMRNRSDFKGALLTYLKNEAVFLNPITKEPYVMNDILSEHKLVHISNPTEFITLYEASPSSDNTRGVVFVDGHSKRVPESEWELWKKRSKIQ